MLTCKSVLIASVLAFSSGAMAQSFEIGPNGVRVDRDRDRVERPYRAEREMRDRDAPRAMIDRREAISIARSQGLTDVESARETRSGWTIDGRDRRGDDVLVRVSGRGDVLDVSRD